MSLAEIAAVVFYHYRAMQLRPIAARSEHELAVVIMTIRIMRTIRMAVWRRVGGRYMKSN